QCCRVLHALHSFPTRRSSDLKHALSTSLPSTSGDDSVNTGSICGTFSADSADSLYRWELYRSQFSALAFSSHWMSSSRTAHGSSDRKSTRLNSSHVKISYAVF